MDIMKEFYDGRGYEPITFSDKKPEQLIVKHIYLLKDQILYDIDAETLIVTRARRDAAKVDNNVTATDEADRLRPLLHRWIDKYADQAKLRLAPYVYNPSGTATMNDIKMWKELDIELHMPEYWNESVYPLLVNAVHDFIVNGTLYDYFSLTLTANDPVTMSKRANMDEALDRIKQYANTVIPGSVRKPLQPF